ncbi:ribonuclease E inhibitor RraB [Flavobacterium sp. FlaQc-47]|uniref:ribonuclease E inhibitor RraB n=1 Tax=Flavobacterium sp. FlaQc-47 TaxID=3374180 RepID=UPI0037583D14
MDFLNFLKPKKKKQLFVSEIDFTANQDKQFRLLIESFLSLHDSSVQDENECKIDYFFYTDSLEKAQKLEKELRKMDYIVNYGIAIHDKSLFVISGRTIEIEMKHETVRKWVEEMCELGYNFDCSFDNWRIVEESK